MKKKKERQDFKYKKARGKIQKIKNPIILSCDTSNPTL
jgi:hypothetical protein